MEPEQFQQLLEEKGIHVLSEQMYQFERYYELLVEWNEKMNLTAITERAEVYEKHFYDSITASLFFDFTKVETLIDIGAGAGFPSLPIKILYPHLKVTIVDSLNKRISFLTHLCNELGIEEVNPVHGRAEDLGVDPKFRERYDVVTARAVARLSILSEYCLPFVKVGGNFVVLKGADGPNELDEAKKAIKILGAKTNQLNELNLPTDQAERSIIVIEKISTTPKGYPRKAGIPTKKPIG
ncbi:MAG TPA: 16S rRNA (guanine(527)-N(7))-methyltransferase RsmG [Bacillota bacterium]|nr:16S rRNA (guanine(527)-N(7))-methyltransferase RsmG [Bacillota bacterium]